MLRVEQEAVHRGEGLVVVLVHRNPHDPVSAGPRRRSAIGRVLGLGVLAVVGVFGSPSPPGAGSSSLSGGKRCGNIGTERHRVDAALAVEGVVPLEVRDLRLEHAVAEVEEVVPLRPPGRRELVEVRPGHPAQLAVARRPDVDGREPARVVEAHGEVAAPGRPDVVVHLAVALVRDLDHRPVGHGHHEDAALFVTEGDPLAVRRPDRVVAHRLPALGELLRGFPAALGHDVDLLFPLASEM